MNGHGQVPCPLGNTRDGPCVVRDGASALSKEHRCVGCGLFPTPTFLRAPDIHDLVEPEALYQDLDRGIRFAVRVLHAAGIETCQSCQGGVGHAYDRPTVDMNAGHDDALGFKALAALADYGLKVSTIAILWNVSNWLPYEKLWRVTFTETFEARADEQPMFVYGYRATEK